MRPKTKVLDRLPRILRPPQQQRITPRRRPHRQLIQRNTLPARLLDASARSGGEVESRDGEFGDREETRVVGYGADYDEGFGYGGGLGGGAAGREHC